MSDEKQFSFRDRIATTTETGGRKWVYANPPKGKLHYYRVLVSVVLLLALFVTPFIKLNGEPLVLLDILQRKFILFGERFYPQDFHIAVFAMIALIVTIVLFTVIYGRIWCGWTCPQTIFMEMIFRKIEFLIEGNAKQQQILNNNAPASERLWKKGLKHFLFVLVSIIITHFLFAYIVGADRIIEFVTSSPLNNLNIFFGMMIFAAAFYLVFGWFREQVCTLVCPYGRFQGALVDSNTLKVSYDFKRGEPRSLFVRKENRAEKQKGDCVDCNSCVAVCPTGIDIRDGVQLECINCTACMDACNSVMSRLKMPRGLIRYATEREIETGEKKRWNIRAIAYTALLVVLMSAIGVMFSLRGDIETTILRVSGTLYQDMGEGRISNVYNYKIVNKSDKEQTITFKLLSHTGEIQVVGKQLIVSKGEKLGGVFLIILEKEELSGNKNALEIGVYIDEKMAETISTTFVGP